jgi:hypothetical protein
MDKRIVGLTVTIQGKDVPKIRKRLRRKLVTLKQAVKRGRKELPGYLREVEKRAEERKRKRSPPFNTADGNA